MWFADSDGDGFGDSTNSLYACNQPSDYIEVDGDCDDGDENINPAATEICNGIDARPDGIHLDNCEDCSAILDGDPSSIDGVYLIDIDGVWWPR